MIDKYMTALDRAMENERNRMNAKGTKNGVIINRRLGFLEGLEHALKIYKIFKEDD